MAEAVSRCLSAPVLLRTEGKTSNASDGERIGEAAHLIGAAGCASRVCCCSSTSAPRPACPAPLRQEIGVAPSSGMQEKGSSSSDLTPASALPASLLLPAGCGPLGGIQRSRKKDKGEEKQTDSTVGWAGGYPPAPAPGLCRDPGERTPSARPRLRGAPRKARVDCRSGHGYPRRPEDKGTGMARPQPDSAPGPVAKFNRGGWKTGAEAAGWESRCAAGPPRPRASHAHGQTRARALKRGAEGRGRERSRGAAAQRPCRAAISPVLSSPRLCPARGDLAGNSAWEQNLSERGEVKSLFNTFRSFKRPGGFRHFSCRSW